MDGAGAPPRYAPAVAPRAVIVSGHLVDGSERRTARFPDHEVDRVAREIDDTWVDWAVGPGTVVVTGGARGTDILASEAALRRGAAVHLCLAVPADEFERRSVATPGSDWAQRFRALLAVASVEVVSPDGGPDDVVFPRANARIVAFARSLDPTPYALLVWDRASGDDSGGTADMAAAVSDLPPDRVRVIDPSPR